MAIYRSAAGSTGEEEWLPPKHGPLGLGDVRRDVMRLLQQHRGCIFLAMQLVAAVIGAIMFPWQSVSTFDGGSLQGLRDVVVASRGTLGAAFTIIIIEIARRGLPSDLFDR